MRYFLTLILFSLVFESQAQNWLTNFEEAKTIAIQKQQPILLVFSGSDWCAPCIELEREIWQLADFQDFAVKNLVLLKADFPRKRKSLSEEQWEHNESLAEKFNTEGAFPKVILMDGNETWSKVIAHQDVENIIPQIQKFIPNSNLENSQLVLQVFRHQTLLMGSAFEIVVVHEDANFAREQIQVAIQEIQRIENLISSWDENSETSFINKNAGIAAVQVSQELFDLITRSKQISLITQGAFDLTYAALDNLWSFEEEKQIIPTNQEVEKVLDNIGFDKIILDETLLTVFLEKEEMKIGFGAIGKGYAAQKTKTILQNNGIESGIINAGGDLYVWGNPPNESAWKIGIANPNQSNEVMAYLAIKSKAVVTSGNYEKFIEIDGKRYTHILDPRTGYPVSGLKSVTIIAPDSELADALATAVFVLGNKIGLDLINQLPQIDCLLIDNHNQIHVSENLELQDWTNQNLEHLIGQ